MPETRTLQLGIRLPEGTDPEVRAVNPAAFL